MANLVAVQRMTLNKKTFCYDQNPKEFNYPRDEAALVKAHALRLVAEGLLFPAGETYCFWISAFDGTCSEEVFGNSWADLVERARAYGVRALEQEELRLELDQRCHDCADFGPLCPNTGRPCGGSFEPVARKPVDPSGLCDCESPEPGRGPSLVSMGCPVHNQNPLPRGES